MEVLKAAQPLPTVELPLASTTSSQTKHEMSLGSALEPLVLSVRVGADLTQLEPFMLVSCKYGVRTAESRVKNV